jgi:hypothetical protein
MALLDFIKNRDGQRPAAEQQSQQQKPENAKEWHNRRDAELTAAQKPIREISEVDQSKARELGARLDKATQEIQQNAPASTPAPADSTSSPEPMRQNMTGQEKSAPDLSPTSAQLGQTANEKAAAAPPQPEAEKTQQPGPQAGQSKTQRPPTWER